MTQQALTITEACKQSGIGRTSLYCAIRSGELKARKYGRRTIVLTCDLKTFLDKLPTVTGSSNKTGESNEE